MSIDLCEVYVDHFFYVFLIDLFIDLKNRFYVFEKMKLYYFMNEKKRWR